MNYDRYDDYGREAELFEQATLLDTDDIRELSWVADVLEDGGPGYSTSPHLSRQELADLAGVIRSKLPEAGSKTLSSEYTVFDKNGAEYKNFDGTWYLVTDGHALEVPFESIQEPRPLRLTVVE